MSNHQSFLKMLGIDGETKAEASISQTDKLDNPAADNEWALENESEGEESQSASGTEWEIEQEQLEKHLDQMPAWEAVPSQNATSDISQSRQTDTDTEFDLSYALPAISSEQTHITKTEHIEIPENSDFRRLSEIVEKTEMVEQEIIEKTEAANPIENIEGTSFYTPEEEAAADQEIEFGHEGQVFSQTRPTVPFDYEPKEGSKSSGTLHFDYDQDNGGSRLVVLEGKSNAKAFHMGNLPLRIGRDPLNEVILDDMNVSRFHAEIRELENRLIVVDLGSTNGIKVNGSLVNEYPLKTHDVLQVGDALFEFLPAGVLSKGVPHSQVMSEESGQGRIKIAKKKRLMIAASIIAVAGIILVIGNWGNVAEKAEKKSLEFVAQKAESEMSSIKSAIENESQKPIDKMEPEAAKKAFVAQLEKSSFASLITPEMKQYLENMPAGVVQLFVEDPRMLANAIESGATPEAFEKVMRAKLNQLAVQKRYPDAILLVEYLLTLNPNDEALKQALDTLKTAVAQDKADVGDDVMTNDEKKFYEYMTTYQNNFDSLLARQKYLDALNFGRLVVNKLHELIDKEPFFERVARSEIEKWEGQNRIAEEKSREDRKKKTIVEEKSRKGSRLFDMIKVHMDFGEAGKARQEIDQFLNEYKDHPRRANVLAYKAEMEKSVDVSFATTESNIEKFIQAESYEAAWNELYRFLDLMPKYPKAVELKKSLEKKTEPRAAQYYNKARVFEFEADDLVAAEQYYKRTMDVADPRSELSEKAKRRYAEVRRRNIQ